MRSRHRSRALGGRLLVGVAAVVAFVVVRDRLIERNRHQYGPPPLASPPTANPA